MSAMDQIGSDMVVDRDSFDENKEVAIITPDGCTPDDSPEPAEQETEDARPRADDFEAMKKRWMPQIQDLEVEAEGEHTWDIQNWRRLAKREHGPVFHVGGHPWRVLFFPSGNNVDCCSFYLEQGFEEKTPERWYACAQFLLVLWNPNDPEIYEPHTATHRFTADEADWGFTRFLELRKLFSNFVSVDGRTFDRPILENESAKLTAYVRVVKDPTGVLWHSFLNYDSKIETGMVGLKNQGATCYLNSLLQSLYFTTAFRKAVYQIPTDPDSEKAKDNCAYALQRLFYQLQTSKAPVATNELTASFGWDSRQIFEQQDVQELSRVLMDKLEDKMKGTEAEGALSRLFLGKSKTFLSCINVEFESSRIEDYWDLQLNVIGMKGLDASFKDYCAVEIMEGDNKYQAEGFGLQDARKGVIFESFPSVLHLQLKRFEYDFTRDIMTKINDRYEFPETWDASPYLSEDADRSEPYIYKLHGVLVHSGELNAGHYYAFLKPEKDGYFYKFDDDRVTRATLKEAIDENFGGEATTNANGHIARPVAQQHRQKRSMNAYMLVYIRECHLDRVLCTSEDVEPPLRVARRCAEEREKLELARKQKEEAHLYMEVQVVNDEIFKAHEGFDIVNFKTKPESPAAPKAYRVLRTMIVEQFLSLVGEDMEIDMKRLRAWSMVNRQNGTVRPDTPILQTNLSVEEASQRFGTKSSGFRIWLEIAQAATEDGQYLFGDEIRDARQVPSRPIVLFLKYFDAEQQHLYGVGHFYALVTDKVSDLSPHILKLMKWPAGTSFKIFEEIKHNLIEPMKPKQTLSQSEIQDGDIITVSKSYSEKETSTLESAGKFTDVRQFYDWLLQKVTIEFVPRGGSDNPDDQFKLTLTKRLSYNQLSAKVGEHLKVDPAYLRFCPVNSSNLRAKLAVKHNTANNLGQILNPGYHAYSGTVNQRNDMLFYEVLEVPLPELETRKNIKVIWLGEEFSKDEQFDILVPKNGDVMDLKQGLARKANVPREQIRRIRLFETHANRIYKIPSDQYAVLNFMDLANLYAELVPEEEVDFSAEDRLISAYHFDKELPKGHGIPFQFLVKRGEIFSATKERISKRIGVKGKMFEKIKFAIVTRTAYMKPEYLSDDDILSDKLEGRDETDMIGLDHPNKAKNIWGRVDSIFIR